MMNRLKSSKKLDLRSGGKNSFRCFGKKESEDVKVGMQNTMHVGKEVKQK